VIAARLLDVLLVLVVLVFVGEGWRNGLLRSLSAIGGIAAGGALAFLAIPLIAAIIPDPFWRMAIVIAVALALLFGGHAAGAAVGQRARGRSRAALGLGTRIAGGVVNGAIAALTVALISGGVAALGMPLFSQAISGSIVLRAIDTVTPPQLDAALSRLRAAVLEQGLPTITDALGGIEDSPGIPDPVDDSDALAAAAQSVVRIGGTAYACGQNQTGSGFVIAVDRVVTNAHVVAGVDQPVVEAPNGQTLEGRIVYFDPVDDLAVVAVTGLAVPPLALSAPLAVGDAAVIEGYPFGGPFTSGPAEVLAISSERIADVYDTERALREVYTLAALVQPGNSGGPLLAADGGVAGVVFARSATDPELGYAMTNTELEPVAAAAAGLDAPIASGSCVRG
jgi:S1-C subfamily serine protease